MTPCMFKQQNPVSGQFFGTSEVASSTNKMSAGRKEGKKKRRVEIKRHTNQTYGVDLVGTQTQTNQGDGNTCWRKDNIKRLLLSGTGIIVMFSKGVRYFRRDIYG